MHIHKHIYVHIYKFIVGITFLKDVSVKGLVPAWAGRRQKPLERRVK